MYGTVRTVVWEDGGREAASYPITLYTTNFTEPLSYQGSAFLKLPKFP